MTWIIYGLLMFCASIVMNLAIRGAKSQRINYAITNFAGFSFPALFLFFYIKINNFTFNIGLKNILLIGIGTFLFSYIGNIFSLKAIEHVSNPGFSFIIQKSYAAFTIFAAIFLFGSTITLVKLLGVIMVIFFAGMIIIDPNKSIKFKNSKWLIYSFVSFFCFGFLSLFSKYFLNLGLNVFVFLFWMTLIDSILFFITALLNFRKSKTIFNYKSYSILFILGIASLAFNIYSQLGFKTAPNIGYINALNTGSIAFVTLFATIIFKDELTRRKMIAVMGIILGLLLIFL